MTYKILNTKTGKSTERDDLTPEDIKQMEATGILVISGPDGKMATEVPTYNPGLMDSFGGGYVQGATMGWEDEVAGLVDDKLKTDERQRLVAEQEDNPKAYAAGQMIGGLLPGLLTRRIPGAGFGRGMLQGGLGGVEGAIAGAGSADSQENIPLEAAKGAVIGLAAEALGPLGRLIPKAPGAIMNAGKNVLGMKTGGLAKKTIDAITGPVPKIPMAPSARTAQAVASKAYNSASDILSDLVNIKDSKSFDIARDAALKLYPELKKSNALGKLPQSLAEKVAVLEQVLKSKTLQKNAADIGTSAAASTGKAASADKPAIGRSIAPGAGFDSPEMKAQLKRKFPKMSNGEIDLMIAKLKPDQGAAGESENDLMADVIAGMDAYFAPPKMKQSAAQLEALMDSGKLSPQEYDLVMSQWEALQGKQ